MFFDFTHQFYKFSISDSKFISYFTDAEVEYICSKYFPTAFNSKGVRLVKIEQLTDDMINLELAESDFFSLLISNILYRKYIDEETKLKEKILKFKEQSVSDLTVLSQKNFANNLAISVLLQDNSGKFLLVKRTQNVVIGASLISVSVTGGIDLEDLQSKNPFYTAVKREVFEELGLKIQDSEISFKGIFIGPTKLQPIVICNVRLDRKFSEINLWDGKDGRFEFEKQIIVKTEELESILLSDMTEASRFQIESVLNSGFL